MIRAALTLLRVLLDALDPAPVCRACARHAVINAELSARLVEQTVEGPPPVTHPLTTLCLGPGFSVEEGPAPRPDTPPVARWDQANWAILYPRGTDGVGAR